VVNYSTSKNPFSPQRHRGTEAQRPLSLNNPYRRIPTDYTKEILIKLRVLYGEKVFLYGLCASAVKWF
jgi:hypothetical protein